MFCDPMPYFNKFNASKGNITESFLYPFPTERMCFTIITMLYVL